MKIPGNWKVWVGSVAVLLVAGSAAAFLINSRRDVTTSSREALRYYRLGLENEEKVYHRDALTAYAQALSHDPYFVMATLRLANYMWDRDPARAESLVRKVSQCREGLTEREKLSLEMFEARFFKKDPDLVLKTIDRFIERYPDDPDGYKERAMYLRKKGDIAGAMASFEKVLVLNPNNAIAYNFLGYYAMEQGDSARAEEHFKRYRFLAPDQANPYDSLGELLTNIGRHDEAEANLRKSLEIKGDFFASLGHLGTVAVGRGDYAKAIEYYEKAAEAADTPSAQFDLALSSVFARMFSDDFDGALRKLDVLAATSTELAEKHRQRREFVLKVVRAAVLARSGDVPAATAILDELEKRRDVPKEGMESEKRIRGLMEATAALKRRDPEPARAFVKAKFVPDGAMSLHSPGYFPAHKLLRVDLASEFLKAGFVADAESLLADVLKVDPNFRVAVDLQRNLEARKAASGARSQTPNG